MIKRPNKLQRLTRKCGRFLKSNSRPLVLVFSFAVVGVIVIAMSKADVPSGSLEAENGTRNGVSIIQDGKASSGQAIRFSDSSVRRFFADDASWNKTVSQMGGELTQMKSFAHRLYDYGGGVKNGPSPDKIRLSILDYSVPIYDAAEATTRAKVFQSGDLTSSLILSRTGVNNGDSIPWNPNWKPGTGNDAIMHLVDYQTGQAHELWMVHGREYNCLSYIILGQFEVGRDLCLGAVERYDNLFTANDQSTIVGRGMGINNLALVTRADEVASGDIGHAIALTISNPMFGPDLIATADEPLQNLAEAGVTKGFFMRPGTRLEHKCSSHSSILLDPSIPMDSNYRSKTIPSGMRFAAKLTDADINAWLNSKGYTGAKRQTAATFARAWRDYGGIVAETGGYGINIETDGAMGPAKAKWEELGIYDSKTNKVDNLDFSGLLTRDNLYVVKPPAKTNEVAAHALKPCK